MPTNWTGRSKILIQKQNEECVLVLLLVCTFVNLVGPVDKEWRISHLLHLSLVLSSQVSATQRLTLKLR